MVTPVAKFKSVSSRTKILRLIALCLKFEVKFVNFGFKFYSPRPAS